MNHHPPLPPWVLEVVRPDREVESDREALAAAVDLAVASARQGGGPFGAVVADRTPRVLAVGWNRVIRTGDSTAHAETEALRAAQARLGTHDLSATAEGPLTLYASSAPCIMCFGAIYWSGLSRVTAAAGPQHAEAIGFDEGPVTDRLWEVARERKGIVYEPEADAGRDVNAPFQAFLQAGGELY